jgi:hypothetical protein
MIIIFIIIIIIFTAVRTQISQPDVGDSRLHIPTALSPGKQIMILIQWECGKAPELFFNQR